MYLIQRVLQQYLQVFCLLLLYPQFCFPLWVVFLLTGILLVYLSVLGAFESPAVQACVPQMQSGVLLSFILPHRNQS